MTPTTQLINVVATNLRIAVNAMQVAWDAMATIERAVSAALGRSWQDDELAELIELTAACDCTELDWNAEAIRYLNEDVQEG